jgi:hypothetical protein
MRKQVGSDGGVAARGSFESTREGRAFPHCGHHRCDDRSMSSIWGIYFFTPSEPSRAAGSRAATGAPRLVVYAPSSHSFKAFPHGRPQSRGGIALEGRQAKEYNHQRYGFILPSFSNL